VFLQQLERVRAEVPRRRAVADDVVRELAQDREALRQLFLLLLARQRRRRRVRVAVVRDLVTGVGDLADAMRIALGVAGGDEERGANPVLPQQTQDQRHGHLRTVPALRQRAGLVGHGGVVRDPRLLGVEVEREGRRASESVRPHGSSSSIPAGSVG
jgi:hypothetical protein